MKATEIPGICTLAALAFGTFFFLAACGSVEPHPPFAAAEFISIPTGADVINTADNATLGTTPFKYVRETAEGEAEYMTVRVVKPGYQEETMSLFISPRYEDRETAMENPQQVEVMLTEKQ
jgi:hypothetical protein